MARTAFVGMALFLVVGAAAATEAKAEEIIIGTGSTSGVNYQVGRAICHMVNAGTADHGIACRALPTPGSIFNLTNVRANRLHLGVAESNWQHQAVLGTGAFEHAGTDRELRALFSVHGAPFTVVARQDAGIGSLDDLQGKRVNIGSPGTDLRATVDLVMNAKGWDKSVFSLANELPAAQQSLALCHDRLQAVVFMVEHPDPSVGRAADLCDLVMVEVKDRAIDKLVRDNPFYSHTEVPGGVYRGNPDPVATFGVPTTVVASAGLDAETAYAVVKAVVENLEQFKKLYPAFGILAPDRMMRDGITAPLHVGALRYYEEKGLM